MVLPGPEAGSVKTDEKFPPPRMMRALRGNTEEVPGTTMEVRPSRPGEQSRLRALWHTVFGDEEACIDWFYRCGCCTP